MPPEVYQFGYVGPKGDVFALGVMTYQIFTGSGPNTMFPPCAQDGPDGFSCCSYNVCNMEVDVSWATPELAEFLNGMLAKNFRERFSMAKALESSFFSDLSGQPSFDPEVLEKMVNAGKTSALGQALITDLADTKNFADLQSLNKAFRAMDTSHTGVVKPDDVRANLGATLPADQLEQMISCLAGSDGEIHYREFIGKLLVAKEADAKSILWKKFQELNVSGTGSLSRDELAPMLKMDCVAGCVGDRGIDGLMDEMDGDHDGQIDFSEFCRVIMGEKKPGIEVGANIEYYSQSNTCWIACQIIEVHQSGYVQVSVKPGAWIKTDSPLLRWPSSS
eukprot:gnl/TRDRNA2_/TRDRNA2_141560_c0_seq1.p1 gnl/TRDRNA2_/TRDRNA2_141560_c0~~gnl/TRDRNA2_/TRDRNA2_141560_c0_seq1.p1  ORF type:complete len:347 (-),score=65.96 gnl/TRDRNA2_/TRDRNA2_141560_c0_seq1:330-1331(-)